MDPAALVLTLVTIWLWTGAGATLVFLCWGIDRIDADARGAYLFRVLLIPATVLLWPLVLRRWWQLEAEAAPWMARYRAVRAAHPLAAMVIVAAMALLLSLGLSARQDWPAGIAPVQLTQTEG